MSTLSLRKIKHDSSSVDNIQLNSNGNTSVGTTNVAGVPLEVGGSVALGRISNTAYSRFLGIGGSGGTFINGTTGGGYIEFTNDTSYNNEIHLVTHWSGNQHARVLSADYKGRVTMPYQPAFLVTRNAGDSGSLSANTVLPFNYTIFNRGNHFNTSTYTFTAPVAGVYMFYTHLYHQLPASTTTRIMIKKNGSEVFQGTDVIPHAFVANYEGVTRDMTSQTSYVIDMNVGDYVNVAVRNGQAGRFYGGHSLFYGYLLG